MSLLKQFGATVSNYLKKSRLNYQKSNKQLKRALFLQPFSIIFLSFLFLLLSFNLFIYYFIDTQIDSSIKEQFIMLDQKYYKQDSIAVNQKYLFSTTYVILDSNDKVVYFSANTNEKTRLKDSQTIVYYLKKKNLSNQLLKENQNETARLDATSIEIDDATYYLDICQYNGELNDYYISQGNHPKSYKVVVFVNSTPLSTFTLQLNLMFAGLILVLGIISWFILYRTSRKIDLSFGKLKDYVISVGQRKGIQKIDQSHYDEFNDIIQAVYTMNTLIDNSEKSQKSFFQNASHELKTPLMSIQGYAESIKEGLSENPQEASEIIYLESLKMKKLVDEILMISRLESLNYQMTLENISLLDLIYDLTWRLNRQAEKKAVRFQHYFKQDYIEVQANEELLEKAILNILTNALRYAKSQITLSANLSDSFVRLDIENDGPKISDEDLPHIFERFYKGSGGHSGIGLSLTKEIIENMGGEVTVESDETRTRFRLLIPLSQK